MESEKTGTDNLTYEAEIETETQRTEERTPRGKAGGVGGTGRWGRTCAQRRGALRAHCTAPGTPLRPAGADGEESGREGACAHGADALYCTAETSTTA